MKFNLKDAVIIALIVTIVIMLMKGSRRSYADPVSELDCQKEPVAASKVCSEVYPDYPEVGDMIENGAKKYCCKKK